MAERSPAPFFAPLREYAVIRTRSGVDLWSSAQAWVVFDAYQSLLGGAVILPADDTLLAVAATSRAEASAQLASLQAAMVALGWTERANG